MSRFDTNGFRVALVDDVSIDGVGVRLGRPAGDGIFEEANGLDEFGRVTFESHSAHTAVAAPTRPLLWLPLGAEVALAEALRARLPDDGNEARVDELRRALDLANLRIDQVLDRYLGKT